MASETELKLVLDDAAVAALDAAGFWPGAAEPVAQRSVYFDTPDRDLDHAGLTLRIRQTRRGRIQTVKAEGDGAGGLFVRPEWEAPLRSDVPVLDESNPVRMLLADRAETLAPLFDVAVSRRTWIVEEAGATIEMVLDRGQILVADRATPLCEIELELKAGDTAAVFALARRIAAAAPVRLGVESKSARGYRLTGPAPSAIKAAPLALTPELSAGQAFQAIVRHCLGLYRRNEALLLAGREADALHQARVALRRLRSAFSIFAPLLGGTRQATLREELRWLAALLGEGRNLDVLLLRVPAGPLHDRLAAVREGAYDRILAELDGARARRLPIDLAEWTALGDWLADPATSAARTRPARDFAAEALDRFRRKVKRGGRDLIDLGDEARHDLRKDAKKLRYGAEFFAGLFDAKRDRRRHRRFVAALAALQDALGALNDLATAPEVLAAIGAGDDPDAAALIRPGKRKSLLKSAAGAHDELIDAKRFWR